MHVELHPKFVHDPRTQRAQSLTQACVHCGFCLNDCPTYIDARDERDSPRGRIYLIAQLLEHGEASARTQTHLDRCLTCRNCETACPSGMQYGELLDIGRAVMETQAARSWWQTLLRRGVRLLFTQPTLFAVLLRIGQSLQLLLSPVLPRALQEKIPRSAKSSRLPAPAVRSREETNAANAPETTHLTGKTGPTPHSSMLLLDGCVQAAATPNTNAAARRTFRRLGIALASTPQAGCCGALDHHLGATEAALARARCNVDAWWPHIDNGASAIVSTASGCGAMLVDYGRLLQDDAAYAKKAKRVSELAVDIGVVLAEQDTSALAINPPSESIALHTPCTLRNALRAAQHPRDVLTRSGFQVLAAAPNPGCCGSAGTYSLLYPARANRLRERELQALTSQSPAIIATANIGCQLHFQGGLPDKESVEVVHWVELLDHYSQV